MTIQSKLEMNKQYDTITMKEVLCDSLTVDTCLECLVSRKHLDTCGTTMQWQFLSEPVIEKFTFDILLHL